MKIEKKYFVHPKRTVCSAVRVADPLVPSYSPSPLLLSPLIRFYLYLPSRGEE